MLNKYIENGSIKQDCAIKALILLLHHFKILHVCDNTFKTIFQMCSFTHRLIFFGEIDFLTDSGKVFHSRSAEEANEPSYIAFFYLGTAREPLVVDLSVR